MIGCRKYLIGEDFSHRQQTALGIEGIDPLNQIFVRGRIDPAQIDELRDCIRRDFLKGFTKVLCGFSPYRDDISALRQIEDGFQGRSSDDVARHAFHKLRFGTHRRERVYWSPDKQRAQDILAPK